MTKIKNKNADIRKTLSGKKLMFCYALYFAAVGILIVYITVPPEFFSFFSLAPFASNGVLGKPFNGNDFTWTEIWLPVENILQYKMDFADKNSLKIISGFAAMAIHMFPVAMVRSLLGQLGFINQELSISTTIREQTMRHIEDPETLVKEGITLSTIEKRYSLEGTKHTEAFLLFKNLINKTDQMRLEAASQVVQPLKDRLLVGYSNVSDLQRVSLHLGILGTFIGLVLAFKNSGLGSAGQLGRFDIGPLVDALQLAFATSIAGLFAALFFLLFNWTMRDLSKNLLSSFEEMAENLIFLSLRLPLSPDVLNQIGILTRHVENVDESIAINSQRSERLTNIIEEGVDKLAGTRKGFDDLIKDVADGQSDLIREIQDFYKTISPEILGKDVKESFEKALIPLSAQAINTAETINSLEKMILKISKSKLEENNAIIAIAENINEFGLKIDDLISHQNNDRVGSESNSSFFDRIRKITRGGGEGKS